MILAFDLTATQPTPDSKFHGAGTYGEIVFLELLNHCSTTGDKVVAVWDSKRYINQELVEAAKSHEIPLCDIREKSSKEIFREYNVSRFYSALLDESIDWDFEGVEVITTVHGLRSLEMPLDKVCYYYEKSLKNKLKDFLKLNFLSEKYFEKVRRGYARFFKGDMKIITVSHHSKASILSFFSKVKPEDISVFASPTFDQVTGRKPDEIKENFDVLEKNGVEKGKYFILTSSARWIKNNIRGVLALDSLFSENASLASDFKVVLTGVSNPDVFKKVINNEDKFILLDYVERDELAYLEKNAYAFIYPSLNEGFGYPPVEAMKFGVPVAASGTSSIPEVCGDAAIYFDPYSVSEIKNRIIQLLDSAVHAEYSKRAEKQYKAVSDLQKKDLSAMVRMLVE